MAIIHDNVTPLARLDLHEGNPPVCGLPQQKAEPWCFTCYQREQAIGQTVEMSNI